MSALPDRELERLSPALEPVELRRGQTLHHARTPIEHVYFIDSGIVAVSGHADRDRWVDVWLVGREGLMGVPLVLGNFDAAPFRRTVRVAGRAHRLRKDALQLLMPDLPEFRRLLLGYVELVVIQIAQSSLCNASHTLTQRLSRWLLFVSERLGSNALPLTHQAFARLLGVRRPSVTACLSILQEQGAITIERGCTRIADASRLEAQCCACNGLLQAQRKRLLDTSTGKEPGANRSTRDVPSLKSTFAGGAHDVADGICRDIGQVERAVLKRPR